MTVDGGQSQPVVVFGEVLFDRFPDGSEVLGGAPFNVAWNLQGLGLEPVLVSRVGEDDLGGRILTAMTDWGMRTAAVQVDPERPTGIVEVTLAGGEPAFDIVAGRAYDSIDEASIPRLPGAAVLYHGSLACRAQGSRAALGSLLRQRPRAVFFDVNLRPPWWQEALVQELMASASDIKMNEDELRQLAPDAHDLRSRGLAVLSRSGARRLHVTRGPQGAVVFPARGEPVEIGPGSGARVVDSVGAGDAFSAVLILGRLRGWPLTTALQRARDFAVAVVGLRGATTVEQSFYEPFATAWGDS